MVALGHDVLGRQQEFLQRGAMPRLSSTGLLCSPTALSRLKFCMLRAPTCSTSAYLADQLDLLDGHHFGDDRQARSARGPAARSSRPFSANPWNE